MHLSEKSVRLNRAGALVAISTCVQSVIGASTPVLANNWTMPVPLAQTVPMPVTHAQVSHAGFTAINPTGFAAIGHASLVNTPGQNTANSRPGWINYNAASMAALSAGRVLPSATQSLFAAATCIGRGRTRAEAGPDLDQR